MLPTKPFGGTGFLQSIRALMDARDGVYAARDGALRYVFLDANFYRLHVLRRPPDKTFTEAATASTARAAANGQVFPSYCWIPGDCSATWEGQIISGHTALPGDPPSAPKFRYFGQTDGMSSGSYRVGRGDPASATPALAEALGRLLPLVDQKAVAATPSTSGTFWTRPALTGKTAYGIARDIDAVVLIVQQDHETGGLMLPAFARLIANAGIDQAVMGDGSDSSTLVVDNVVEVTPGEYLKNRGIPVGPAFMLHRLKVAPPATLKNVRRLTTDPRLRRSFTATGTEGMLSLQNGAVKLVLTSLGAAVAGGNFGKYLGVRLPVTLRASGARLAAGPMKGGKLILTPKLMISATASATLRGRMRVTTTRGVVVLNVDWPLEVVT